MPVASDGKVGPSTLESKQSLLERVQVSERTLEVGPPRSPLQLATRPRASQLAARLPRAACRASTGRARAGTQQTAGRPC